MAFGLHEPALDGNIRRVLARVFNVTEAADSAAGQSVLWALASAQLPKSRAGDYNQALMDLGALICLPKEPKCLQCPVTKMCQAYRRGIQKKLPVLRPRKPTPSYQLAAVVIRRRGRVLLAQRSLRGLLGGMWEFPNARVGAAGHRPGSAVTGLSRALKDAYGLRVRRRENLTVIRHAYTHFRVTVLALDCELLSMSGTRKLRWIAIARLPQYPMGKVDRQIARQLGR
jgi:A/G-specific adenine glycosylase